YYDPATEDVVDLVGGCADLELGVLRTVGEPSARFTEDALRLLRAIRFATRLSFEIEPATWEAIRRLAPSISHVSPERQRDELTRMLQDRKPSRAFRLMDESGLLKLVLPEISAMKGVRQGRDAHPEGDVFEHTMLCLDNLDRKNPEACWAMLLHDVAKPVTFDYSNGRITFYGHDAIGAEMAERICHRFRFSNGETERISQIVARHMRYVTAREWNNSTMRRFLSAQTIEDDLAIHRSDCLSCHGNLASWEHVPGALAEFTSRGEPPLPPPLLNGDDLIAMGFKPGPLFREILDAVQEKQLEGVIESRAAAQDFVMRHFSSGTIHTH
ncbi:CCA tRNA nucleotidyltransferase, partial [Candidatus Poribacteria bacterium]|nr:CCA tRNA nucleotidyltransferase [Candidatus Poribacteria bacterium]